ncbi:hypothetical protein [Legionella gresilensis]|uniref:hypothetical protein n=1 Tax=Legionella gresilensis TaxID=91823 RepID=UPI001041934F|nr:hypothetical protein [Legionella gresilensis]
MFGLFRNTSVSKKDGYLSPSEAVSYLENKMRDKVKIKIKNDFILITLLASYTTLAWARISSNKGEISLNGSYLEQNCKDKIDKYVTNSFFNPDIYYSDIDCQKSFDEIKKNLISNLFYNISSGAAIFYSSYRCLTNLYYLWNITLGYEGLSLGQLLSSSEIEEFKELYKNVSFIPPRLGNSGFSALIGLEEITNPQRGVKNIIDTLNALIPDIRQGRKDIEAEEAATGSIKSVLLQKV